MAQTYSSDETAELLKVAVANSDELELRAGARLADADSGELLLLTPEEAEALETGDASLAGFDALREAVERLGRIRLRLAHEAARRPETMTPDEAADHAWRLVAEALTNVALPDDLTNVGAIVDAYLALRVHAGNGRRHKDEVEAVKAEARAIERRALAVLEEARALGKDTFEGRLEVLGVRLDDLGEVAG